MEPLERFEEQVRQKIALVLQGDFFTSLRSTPVSLKGYKLFVKQKYGAVSYFLDFLKRGVEVSKERSPKIAYIFQENVNDEIGCFAGDVRAEYAHESWRLRSLKEFGVEANDLKDTALLPNVMKHQEIIATLPKSNSFFELVGALLFYELFVVYEMKELINAFERDLPSIFPKDGYDYKNFPHNVQEYWYSHSTHDVWHFKQIREGLQSYLAANPLSPDDLKQVEAGIEKVYEAKKELYNQAFFQAIVSV